jgi:hypothetical protein
MRKAGKRCRCTVQVTLQETGTMLLGYRDWRGADDAGDFDVDVIG